MQDGQKESNWVFRPGDDGQNSSGQDVNQGADETPVLSPDMPHIEWTASEYIANPKSKGWFMLLALASVLLAGLIYVMTQDVVSVVIIAIMGIMMGVFAARQPRVLRYAIDNTGLHIGEKFYSYSQFKSFSVADDHAMGYISLMPLRRFMPPLTVHYDPEDEDKIASTLSEYLPFEEHKPDMVENITRRFRF